MDNKNQSKNLSELMSIALPAIGCATEMSEITYKKYKDHHPEITESMNMVEMINLVKKKPAVF